MEPLPSHQDARAVSSRNPQTRHVHDVENNSPLTEPASAHLGTSFYQRIGRFVRSLTTSTLPTDPTAPSPLSQTEECCFICIARNGHDTVAMQISCPQIRPGQKERETEIYDEITKKLLVYYGIRRFLPFYGVRDVQEVNVWIALANKSHSNHVLMSVRSSSSTTLWRTCMELSRLSLIH
jgi:hypothetical protein